MDCLKKLGGNRAKIEFAGKENGPRFSVARDDQMKLNYFLFKRFLGSDRPRCVTALFSVNLTAIR